MRKRWEKLFVVVVSIWGIIRIIGTRPKILVFAGDMMGVHGYDQRIGKLYEWLQSHDVQYAHLIHVVTDGQVIRHWLKRTGPVVYAEGLAWLGGSVRVLSWLIQIGHIREIWGIDDYRNWQPIIAAAHRAGIKIILFQHGRFTRHQRYLAFANIPSNRILMPDALIVWNEYWRRKLLQVSPPFHQHEGVVQVGGKPSSSVVVVRTTEQRSDGKLRIILVHEPATPAGEIQALIDRLSALPDVRLIYKVRRDQPVAAQLKRLNLNAQWLVMPEVVPADLVLGSYSTLLYEMIEEKVPVGVLKIASMQADDLVLDGLASYVDPQAEDLKAELDRAMQVGPEELARRAEYMRIPVPIEKTLEHLLHA